MNTAAERRDLQPGDGLRPRDWTLLFGLLGLAALVRAIAWSRTAVLFNDGPIFLALAEGLREGRFADVLAHPQHPLYPALIAVLEPLVRSPELAAVAVSIAGGLLAIAALFRIAWSRFGPEVAWSVAWVAVLHPWAVDFSSDVMSDGLYAGLYLASFACLLALFERAGAGRACTFGLLAGLAYLTRPEGLGIVLVAVVLLVAQAWREPVQRSRWLLSAIGVLVVSGALAGGLRILESRVDEGFALTQKKSVAQLARGGPSAEELALDRQARRASLGDPRALPLPEGSIRQDGPGIDRPDRSVPGLVEAVVRVLRTSLAAFRYELFAFVCLGLAALGLRALREPRRSALVVGSTLVVYTGLLVLLVWGAGYVSRRHALAVWLPLTPYAVVGWRVAVSSVGAASARSAVGRRLLAGGRALFGARASLVLLVAVLALAWGPRDLRERRNDRALERVAAEWLKQQEIRPGPVAAQKRRTAYYAGAVFVPIPDGRDGLIERQLRGRGARWLIIDADKLDDHLGLAEGVGRWLSRVHAERAGSQEILVLELTPVPAG